MMMIVMMVMFSFEAWCRNRCRGTDIDLCKLTFGC